MKNQWIVITFLIFIGMGCVIYYGNQLFNDIEESNDPSNSIISDVAIVDNTSFKNIEFKQNGEIKKVNLDAIKTIELSDKEFSYYDYWQPYYTFYLTKEEYSKVFDENHE